MNPDSELFKKLVKDAGIQLVHWDDSPRLYIENMTYDGNLAKFAELIVKECADIARLNTRVDSKVYLMIQEHFGVEE
jgi:hypothetical protein